MPLPGASLNALVVARERQDRRELFDALDRLGFDAIHSAGDLGQAQLALQPGQQPDLMLVELAPDPAAALAFCAGLASSGAAAPLLIGLLPAGAGVPAGDTGAVQPADWLGLPVRGDEAEARVRALLASARRPLQAPAAPDVADYQFAFDGSRDELAVVDPAAGAIVEVNPAFERGSGWSREQLIGAPISRFDALLTPAQRSALATALAVDGHARLATRKPAADGGAYPVDMHVQAAMRAGDVVHVYAFRSTGELQRHRDALAALSAAAVMGRGSAQAALAALASWLRPDVLLWLGRPAADGQAAPVLHAHHQLPLPPELANGAHPGWLQAVLQGEEVLLPSAAWRGLPGGPPAREWRLECVLGLPLRDGDQQLAGALLLGRREALDDAAAVQAVRVVAHTLALELALRHEREEARNVGLSDPLTGLPNRLLFNDRLASAIREAQRTHEHFAVVFVDLDRFKNVNDSLGHSVGDELLRAVAARLEATVRAADTVARYAGDEFTLILRHIKQRDDALRVAEKLVAAMEAPLQLSDGLELGITASVGISFYPDDADDAERLVKHADVAMYSAKGLGRNTVQTYVAVPEESHRQRLALEAKLRNAEKNGELRVFYQPQIDTRSEDILGMEALIRWEHPELGMISPGFFIPLAEESGLIVSLGEWILRAACLDAQRWQQEFALPLRLGVNLSALQLRQPDLVERVTAVLKETGFDPRLLELEVTESISVKSVPGLLDTLAGLRALGCGIAIDDFGTGQSSLDYLRRFPADRIKIDQAFVRNIGIDPDDEAIIHATITMAHNLHREVVAEGVETEQHLDFLRSHDCEVVQGFLFSRPLPAGVFRDMLEQRRELLEHSSFIDVGA